LSRSTTLLRSALGAAVLGSALLLAGCGGAPAAPVVTETPKPEPDFGSIGGETPVPIETGDPIETPVPSEDGFTPVFDDRGVVVVSVPSEWTDVDGAGFTTDAGQEWAYVAASPDLAGYNQSWSTPGVEVAATPIEPIDAATLDGQLQGLLGSISTGYQECGGVTEDAAAYDDGYFTGYVSLYEDCGENGTVAFAIAATNGDGTQVVFVRGQITTDYDVQAVYDEITSSFDTSVSRSAGDSKN
jgi:serine protease Do